jgi:hypothetical protein
MIGNPTSIMEGNAVNGKIDATTGIDEGSGAGVSIEDAGRSPAGRGSAVSNPLENHPLLRPESISRRRGSILCTIEVEWVRGMRSSPGPS